MITILDAAVKSEQERVDRRTNVAVTAIKSMRGPDQSFKDKAKDCFSELIVDTLDSDMDTLSSAVGEAGRESFAFLRRIVLLVKDAASTMLAIPTEDFPRAYSPETNGTQVF